MDAPGIVSTDFSHALLRLTTISALVGVCSGCISSRYHDTVEGECERVFVPSVELDVGLPLGSKGPIRMVIKGHMFNTQADAHVSGRMDGEGEVDADVTGDLRAWWVCAGVQGRFPSASERVEVRAVGGLAASGTEYEYVWLGAVPGMKDASAFDLSLGGELELLVVVIPCLRATAACQGYVGFDDSLWSMAAGLELRISEGARLQTGWRWGSIGNWDPGEPVPSGNMFVAAFEGGHETDFSFSGPYAGLVIAF